VWDSHLVDPGVNKRLRDLRTRLLRYPGGSTSDIYHWRRNVITSGQQGYADPANSFDRFMRHVVHPSRAGAIITVNYGSNASGTGGGSPAEAASWVHYANKVRGYGVRYWEVGNEVYGNGYYGAQWETDLHSNHSPSTYAHHALQFIRQMKASDPSIKVGLVLVAPGTWPDGQGPEDWNRTVLSIAGKQADFVAIHWYPQEPGSESDSGLLRAPSTIPSIMRRLRTLLTSCCGRKGHMPVMVTETNSVSSKPGKQTVGSVNGLFAIAAYLAWLKAGASTVAWWALHNSPETHNNNSSRLEGWANFGDYGLLSMGQPPEPAAGTPYPTYWALKLLSECVVPGSRFLSAASKPAVKSYALRLPNGTVAVVLLNPAPGARRSFSVQLRGLGDVRAVSGTAYTQEVPSLRRAAVALSGGRVSGSLPGRSALLVLLRTSRSL
jgi:hypothetical protein